MLTMADPPKSKRKRKLQSAPIFSKPTEGTSIQLSNTFAGLSDLNDMDTESIQPSTSQNFNRNSDVKSIKSPPVVVAVAEFKSFKTELGTFIPDLKVSYQIGKRGECRVFTENVAEHKRLLQYLKDKKHKFYSFDTKDARPFKVVLKGLSNDQSISEIQSEIAGLVGFNPSQVVLMKKKSNNKIHSGIRPELYLVHFNRNEVNNLSIFEKARFLFHVRVKWEHYKKHGVNLTQCRNCQKFGHGTRNCGLEAKCMICGNASHTKDNCPVKETTGSFKCTNCGGNHKANFFNCPVREKILNARSRQTNVGNSVNLQRPSPNLPASVVESRSTNPVATSSGTSHTVLPTNTSNNSRTYANVLVGSQRTTQVPNLTNVRVGHQRTVQVPNLTTPPLVPSPQDRPGVKSTSLPNLGNITPEKLKFLQESMMGMISAMLNCNSMTEAVQCSLKFTNQIVMKLKFSNDFN